MKFEETYTGKIFTALVSLKENDILDKEQFIIKHWGRYDFRTMRSFDVAYYKAKKMLKPLKFKCNSGEIKRVLPEIERFNNLKMDKESVIHILEQYNAWRLGAETDMIDVKIITAAINTAVELLKLSDD